MPRRASLRKQDAARTSSKRRRVTIAALVLMLAATFFPASAQALSSSPGELYAFGVNEFGQLGNTLRNGSETANPTPLPVGIPSAGGPVVQAAVGAGASLVLTADGKLYSFGSNLDGQLGRALNSGTPTPNPTPAQVSIPAGSGPFVQIAAGGRQSLALTSGGTLYAFGSNLYGQLGAGTNAGKEAPNPTPIAVSLPGASGPVSEIAAGDAHSLALTSTGQLYAFGENNDGQLGVATNSGMTLANPTPLLVSLPGAEGPVVQIAAGFSHSLALTSTGQLYAFGSNEFGQLGNPGHAGTTTPTPTPTQVSLPGASAPVSQIAAGGFHSLALTSTGQLYAFGKNSSGQLGSESGAATANPTPTPVSLPEGTGPIVQLAAGTGDSLLVTAEGRLYAFGANSVGQLGNSTNSGTASPNPTPMLANIPAGTTIDTVARGATAGHTLALTADLAVLNDSLAPGQVGVAYGAQALASGGTGIYSWSASGLPVGLSIDPLSGRIGGTPSSTGVSNVVLRARDLFGVGATSATLPLTIAAVPATRAFISSTLTEAQIRASLSMQLGAKGRRIKLSALRKKRSYVYAFTALTAGTLAIGWYYLPPGAHLARAAPVVFASAKVGFPVAGTRKVTLRLTLAGRKLLRHRKRIALTAQGSFTPNGKRPITARRSFRLPQ
jgi:alpha-tubulin suppressor-like RCC1 family protein